MNMLINHFIIASRAYSQQAEVEEQDVLDGDLGMLPMDVVDDGEDDPV